MPICMTCVKRSDTSASMTTHVSLRAWLDFPRDCGLYPQHGAFLPQQNILAGLRITIGFLDIIPIAESEETLDWLQIFQQL